MPPPGYPIARDSKANMLEYLSGSPMNWMVPKESSHLWLLANMIVPLKSEPLLSRFMRYVIAACHPKIKK
ncbi:hypothetical protein K443DRAFT_11746 [Laccaria amethystina LaAM-08-1]|uniref:Uncharacterized protein n=1 Tax=Laccaria amethystina LaAM-08-1 TaxID=1095629 RepID=A0A0C9X0W1_9AGAR|nr:hypothetical protein K443DRAFT_11746 [Laccaria amethystina LaAM-08-1]